MMSAPRVPLLTRIAPLTAAVAVALTAAGCSIPDGGSGSPGHASAPAARQAESVPTGTPVGNAQEILAEHGLEGMDAREVIDHLERMPVEDRPVDLLASVRTDALVLQTQDGRAASLPLPDGEFYLSLAPYQEQTHACFFHSLTTCRGELSGRQVTVAVTRDDGAVLVPEQEITLEDNGFTGLWLPQDTEAMLTVTDDDGATAEVPIRTGAEDPTCLTTVRLS